MDHADMELQFAVGVKIPGSIRLLTFELLYLLVCNSDTLLQIRLERKTSSTFSHI